MQWLRSGVGRFSRQCFFRRYLYVRVGVVATLLTLSAQIARADEGGVSFWIPGFFDSLVAVPAQSPGWSMTSIYYHDSVSAGDGGSAAHVYKANVHEIGALVATHHFVANEPLFV
jgi:hypothetical protein